MVLRMKVFGRKPTKRGDRANKSRRRFTRGMLAGFGLLSLGPLAGCVSAENRMRELVTNWEKFTLQEFKEKIVGFANAKNNGEATFNLFGLLKVMLKKTTKEDEKVKELVKLLKDAFNFMDEGHMINLFNNTNMDSDQEFQNLVAEIFRHSSNRIRADDFGTVRKRFQACLVAAENFRKIDTEIEKTIYEHIGYYAEQHPRILTPENVGYLSDHTIDQLFLGVINRAAYVPEESRYIVTRTLVHILISSTTKDHLKTAAELLADGRKSDPLNIEQENNLLIEFTHEVNEKVLGAMVELARARNLELFAGKMSDIVFSTGVGARPNYGQELKYKTAKALKEMVRNNPVLFGTGLERHNVLMKCTEVIADGSFDRRRSKPGFR